MARSETICTTIADKFHLSAPPTLILDPYKGAPISALRIRSRSGEIGRTDKIPPQDTFVFGLHLLEAPRKQMWSGTTPFTLDAVVPGQATMLNLRCEPSAYIPCATDVLTLYVPRKTFNNFSDGAELQRVCELTTPPHRAVSDPTLTHLASLLVPALGSDSFASKLFLDYVALALLAHLAHAYAGVRDAVSRTTGGLAPWQERCARDLIMKNLSENVSLADLARQCKLSTSHFARAFRQTTGQTPHGWLLERRIERAKDLLLNASMNLSGIALACGFADQSHFTRAFGQRVGATPGFWRRTIQPARPMCTKGAVAS